MAGLDEKSSPALMIQSQGLTLSYIQAQPTALGSSIFAKSAMGLLWRQTSYYNGFHRAFSELKDHHYFWLQKKDKWYKTVLSIRLQI